MKAAVLSDGGWGTALALLLHNNGCRVTLWGAFPDYVQEMRHTRANPRFLPGVPIPEEVTLTGDMSEAVAGVDLVVLASPSQYMRGTLDRLSRCAIRPATALYVSVAKGIEEGTCLRMSELVAEVLGDVPLAVLSGPSHAEEVARDIPTAVVAASRDVGVAARVQNTFMNPRFRVYTQDDVLGVELGGALKNIYAVAAGACDGLRFGDNTKAALMTRAIVEMARLGVALGGRAETFSGLSGIGDLIVTCTSRHSRNRHVGEELGKGRRLAEIQGEMGRVVAEGVRTTRAAHELAERIGTGVPIVREVYAVLYENKAPGQAVHELMTRDPKSENRSCNAAATNTLPG